MWIFKFVNENLHLNHEILRYLQLIWKSSEVNAPYIKTDKIGAQYLDFCHQLYLKKPETVVLIGNFDMEVLIYLK